MKRRDFLRRSLPLAAVPFTLHGIPVRAYGRHPVLEALTAAAVETDRVLVLIQLTGGNDGLNMVLPLDQYANYLNARSNIAIPETAALALTDRTGLHPSMTGTRDRCRAGTLAVVQSVGYPSPNFSHFRSTDIWLTASDSNVYLSTGWVGRYFEDAFPGFPDGYPNAVMPDPLAIQIGSVISTSLVGTTGPMGMAISSVTNFYNFIEGTVEPAPNTPYGHELSFVRLAVQQTDKYADTIKAAAAKATSVSAKYPANSSLAAQLKIVAQLVGGGLKTRVYIVSLGGFDTHSAQVNAGDTTTGKHANLLGDLSACIDAFMDDCTLLGVGDRVVGMTFSEFGRRIKSNGSNGTDHGAAAPLFVFGDNVLGGVLGDNPVIPSSPSVNSNIPMLYDFRSVYATVLRDWFGADESVLRDVLFTDFQILPLFRTSPTAADRPAAAGAALLGQNYPNPFHPRTRIPFVSAGGRVLISVLDELGREVGRAADATYGAGAHTVDFDAGNLPSGLYYCRMQSGTYQSVRPMIVAR
jgi:uncharacterized protein (DUF1501 family)